MLREPQRGRSALERFQLTGKTAIVTGASSGIGAGVAATLAQAGATVYAVARRKERLATLASQQPGIEAWPADLSDDEEREALVGRVLAHAQRIDVLVNNAGVGNIARAHEEPTQDFVHVVDVNLTAMFVLSREAGKAMIERGEGGAIVNISSVSGIVGIGYPPQAAYAASKGGCISLTRELAAQWARHDIRVNALAPGWVDTEMTREWLLTESGQKTVARLAPLRRVASVEEIACAALFLASDASSYVTGTTLTVDGGMTAI